MWGFFQNRGFYQFTNGFTTQYALNDGVSGAALVSFELGLPAARQGQAGVPQMNLRQWYLDGYGQDAWRMTSTTTLTYGVRYEYMDPLVDIHYTNSNLDLSGAAPQIFIGGQNGFPRGLMYPNRANFAPRLGLAQSIPHLGLVAHLAYGIFYTPVDMNTWCNQRHNVPYVFPLTAQSDPFTPSIPNLLFPKPVLGVSVVSFTGLELRAPAQYVQQWSASVEKQLGAHTTIELGYLGAGGFHLQRSHLINNAQPGPGLIQPRRPHPKVKFVDNTVLPPGVATGPTFDTDHLTPVSTMNLLENSAQSWYDAGYVVARRRYSNGLSFLANYTFAKALQNAPDFRSAMFEAATPQNNDNLNAEKGPGCDIRHRVAVSAVYNARPYAQLARLRRLSGANRLADHHLGLRRYRERRHSRRREPHPRQPHRQANLRLRNAQRQHLVESRGIRDAAGLLLRQRRPQFRLRSRPADNGHRRSPLLQHQGEGAVRNARRVLQRAQPHQSRHPQPLRQHVELRQHHRRRHARPRNPAQRAPLVLTQQHARLHVLAFAFLSVIPGGNLLLPLPSHFSHAAAELFPKKPLHLRPHLLCALHRCKMPAPLGNLELRLRNERVHLLSLRQREDTILRSPHEQDRHLQLRQLSIRRVPSGKHGIQRAPHHPPVAPRDAQNIVRDKTRNLRRMRHQQIVELIELSTVSRAEQRRVPCRIFVETCAVEQHQPPDAIGMVDRDALRDPPAHRPAAQIGLLHAKRVHEGHNRRGLVRNRIRKIRRPLASSEPRQIRRDHAEAAAHQVGRQVAPVLRLAAESMHQHNRLAALRPSVVIMQANPVHRNPPAACPGHVHLHVEQAVEVAHRPQIKPDPERENQRDEHTEHPPCFAQRPHFALSFSFCTRCHAASTTRAVIGSIASAEWLFHSARSVHRASAASDAACNVPPVTQHR